MGAEEVAELQERLADAQAELDVLRSEAADSAARISHLKQENTQLHKELTQARNAVGVGREEK